MAPIIPILRRIRTSDHGFTGSLILITLGSGSMDMDALTRATGLAEVTIHEWVKKLRALGLVTSKRTGIPTRGERQATYSVTGNGGKQVIALLKPDLLKKPKETTNA